MLKMAVISTSPPRPSMAPARPQPAETGWLPKDASFPRLRSRPNKILNVAQRLRLRFCRACGLATGDEARL